MSYILASAARSSFAGYPVEITQGGTGYTNAFDGATALVNGATSQPSIGTLAAFGQETIANPASDTSSNNDAIIAILDFLRDVKILDTI